jgi:hypothetical protein
MPRKNALHAQRSRPMSLGAFHSEAKRYGSILQEEELALLKIYYTFISSKHIWPDQYKRIKSLLGLMLEVVRAFCKLLANPMSLPPPVVPNRYLLLATLQHIDERTQTLSHLVTNLRDQRNISSERAAKLHLEIERNLELLTQNCHDALRHFQVLSDQIYFEERKQAQFISDQQEPALLRAPYTDGYEKYEPRSLYPLVTTL